MGSKEPLGGNKGSSPALRRSPNHKLRRNKSLQAKHLPEREYRVKRSMDPAFCLGCNALKIINLPDAMHMCCFKPLSADLQHQLSTIYLN